VNNPNPWSAEFVIDPSLAKKLIDDQFPELRPATLELIGEGWDNFVFRVNSEFVFRFPRRKLGADLIQNEAILLPKIQPRLPIAIPQVLFHGQSTDEFQWSFLGYRYLPGTTACRANLTNEERNQIAPVLGIFLSTLHQISEPEALSLGAIQDAIGQLDLQKRIPATLEYLEKVRELGLFQNLEPLHAVVEQTRNLTDRQTSSRLKTLLHGDLYIRHLMVDSNRKLSGVIDWGDIHVGDPALDLQIVFFVLPKEAHPLFFKGYGPISEETWLLARFRALYSSLVSTVYAHSIGDLDLFREGRIGLTHLVELSDLKVADSLG